VLIAFVRFGKLGCLRQKERVAFVR
jgi:hypothetical protein